MSRWSPDARVRLEKAAFELFLERGYDQTTVADIAARAELTERTFFRHYADKREVLFGGATELAAELVRALAAAPLHLSSIEAARAAVEAVANLMHVRRADARERHKVIATHPDLQERGLIKRAKLTAALAQGLQERGVPELEASLAADIGIAVFYGSFERWLDDSTDRELSEIIRDGFGRVKTVAARI